MTTEFNVGDDIIDVRDIIARVEELREEKQDLIATIGVAESEYKEEMTSESMLSLESEKDSYEDWRTNNGAELDTLESLLSDLCGYGGDEQWEGDWYPLTLIHEDYFEASMDEMVADCYEIPKDLPSFMTITLDYDALKQDYSEVEFDGQTYYYR